MNKLRILIILIAVAFTAASCDAPIVKVKLCREGDCNTYWTNYGTNGVDIDTGCFRGYTDRFRNEAIRICGDFEVKELFQ